MASRFRIGDLTLDTGRHVVLRDSKAIALGPLTYQLLRTLVAAAPNVVSHDELIDAIWKGRSVSPETISQRIKLLRDALSDDPHHPRYVELVRGGGYRLVPRVEVLPDDSTTRERFPWRATFVAALAVLAIAATLYWFTRESTRAPQQVRSIAVLPFADLSPTRDQQYLADGIAEEILNLLSKAPTLRVIARTSSFSFRDKEEVDVPHIAETLGATHILEGSVRKSGERVRVSVRLVDASDGSRLWSESYDRALGDILALQTDVARSVAAALDVSLSTEARAVVPRVDPAAYESYLRGQQQLRYGSLRDAERSLERAIELDAEFIPGYQGLGMVYILQVVSVTRSVAQNRDRLRDIVNRGLRIAPDDVGLLVLSGQVARYEGDIALAEERFAAAFDKDPSNSILGLVYPIFKLDQSDPAEALAMNRRARALDPLNPFIYVNMWASYMDLWDTEQALEAAAYFRELQPAADPWRDALTAITKWYLSGDLAGSKQYIDAAAARVRAGETGIVSWLPMLYYFIDDVPTADAFLALARERGEYASEQMAVEAYRHLAHGGFEAAGRTALAALSTPRTWGGHDDDFTIIRLASEALIENGKARQVIEFLETLAPEYARYRTSSEMDPQAFSPAPVPVKSAFSTFPALYFADYIRALRAIGDDAGANQMLVHLEGILDLRRARGLFLEERHAAEAHALRGHTEEALRALEKAERDRTIYHRWQLVLLHNELFSEFRDHPRFTSLVERIREDVRRQRERLSYIDSPSSR